MDVKREMAELSQRTGRGRSRAFSLAVDLSPEGVAAWLAEQLREADRKTAAEVPVAEQLVDVDVRPDPRCPGEWEVAEVYRVSQRDGGTRERRVVIGDGFPSEERAMAYALRRAEKAGL